LIQWTIRKILGANAELKKQQVPVQSPEEYTDAEGGRKSFSRKGAERANAELKTAGSRTKPRRIYGRRIRPEILLLRGFGREPAELKIGGLKA